MDLVIPVATTSVLSAVKAVAELVSAFEETAPTAFIELHPVLGVWREAGSDDWRVLRRNWNATGLPSYGPPKFNGDEITILRYVLALHVRVPLARVIAAHARLMETLAETVAQGLEAGLPGPMLVPVCVGAEDCKYKQCVNGMRHEWLPIPLKGGIDRLLEDKETGTCLQELVAADLAASKGIFAYFVDKATLERRLFTEEMAQACLAEVQRMKRQRPKAAESCLSQRFRPCIRPCIRHSPPNHFRASRRFYKRKNRPIRGIPRAKQRTLPHRKPAISPVLPRERER